MSIAPVLRATHVHRSPETAFALFTDRIGAWWPLRTHGLYLERSAGLEFRDGCLVERSLDGDETVWGEVVVWEPPTRLVVTWHPGDKISPASELELRFVGDADGTRVELSHHGWDGFGETDGLVRRDGYVGPRTWGTVLDDFTDISDRLAPGIDLSALVAAYESFFAEAAAGGFGPPPSGEWSAEQIVAHIALNDDDLGAVCRGLLHDAEVRYENTVAIDPARLEATIDGRSLAQLVELGRHRSAQLLAVLGRLERERLEREVPCVIRDGETIAFEGLVRWGRLMLDVQPGVHLANHIEQLRALRR